MFQSIILIYNQYSRQKRITTTPYFSKSQNKINLLNDLDFDVSPQLRNSPIKENTSDYSSKNNTQLFIQQFSREIQQKPKIKTIFISYIICAFFNLYNIQNIQKFNSAESQTSMDNDSESKNSETYYDDILNAIIFQFIAQDYFIYTAVRLIFHEKILRKVELKDLIVSFWLYYAMCSIILMLALIVISSVWQNMLIFTIFNTYLIYKYRDEQNSLQNLFQIRSSLENLLTRSRRIIEEGEEQQDVNNNENQEQTDNNDNTNNNQTINNNNTNNRRVNIANNGYESDENEEQRDAVRLNVRRSHTSNRRSNPIVTELVQQFIGEHYERNQVIQIIQIGESKTLVIYKINQIKYAAIYIQSGKIKLSTQKIDQNCIVLHYYWESLNLKQNDINNNSSKKFINVGVMYNTYTGKLILFTINAKDIGVVNKEHIVLHEQYPKFVTLRLKDILFRDLIKNEMSSLTLVNYGNRQLQTYQSIEDTDYIISTEEETLIITSILSIVEWKPNNIGNDWEIELMNIPSSDLSPAQNSLMMNYSFSGKKQYFIQEKTKTYDFPTNIKSINILNKRHLFIQDEDCFYVYSIPTSQIIQKLSNKYVDGFQIVSINRTIKHPNLNLDQFLLIQNYIQKVIADALGKTQNISKSGITTENPTLIYLSQYKSIPITYIGNTSNTGTNQKQQQPSIQFILPKEIQSTDVSTLQTENIFQIKNVPLSTVLQPVSQ